MELEVKGQDTKDQAINEKDQNTAAAPVENAPAAEQDDQLNRIIKKKKRHMPKWLKWLIALVIIGAVAAFAVSNIIASKNAPTALQTVTASKGDVEQTINSSGTVDSMNEKTYYAEASAQIKSVSINKGDIVKAGDVLLMYDTSDLETAKEKADLQAQANDATMNEQLETNNKNTYDFITSSLSLSSNEAQIASLEAKLNDIQCQMASNTKWLNANQSQLTSEISDLETQRLTTDSQDRKNQIDDEIQNRKNQINGHDNTGLSEELRVGNAALSKLQTAKSEDKSKKDTAENGIITDTKKYEIATNKKLDDVNRQEAADNLAKASDGVTAEFSGIVKDVKAEQGMMAAPGTELFTIDDTQNIKVDIQVSKYDLDNIKEGQLVDITIADKKYNGKVSKVNHIAEKNSSGASVVTAEISVLNPDEDIFIGVEAKCVIHVAKAEGVLILPVEAVNADTDGSYCYVIRDGVVVKQPVETGVTSDTYVEITKGIAEGDKVVDDTSVEITEGMSATAVDITSDDDSESTGSGNSVSADSASVNGGVSEDGDKE